MTTPNSQEFSTCFISLQMMKRYGLHTVQWWQCQWMMLLPDQINKRTYFWIIRISWLCPISNLIFWSNFFLTCTFEKLISYFLQMFLARGFITLQALHCLFFFLLATILNMAMFKFQWVWIKAVSWYYLTWCTSLFLFVF